MATLSTRVLSEHAESVIATKPLAQMRASMLPSKMPKRRQIAQKTAFLAGA